MSPIGSINPALNAMPLVRTEGTGLGLPAGPAGLSSTQSAPGGFDNMLNGLVSMVENKTTDAQDLTNRVLLGNTDQLHQSVIAMQEASTAFSLMVQVRNKLVDSYQELMHMQV